MKKIKYIYLVLFAGLFLTISCIDDDKELGRRLDKSEIQFEVLQPQSLDVGGNTVILKNNTPSTMSMWDYGTGQSSRQIDTVRFPFQGEYTINFSAVTAGGIVQMDPVKITVTENNLTYLSDPMWGLLAGGIGQEKVWILDYGKHGIFDGPVYYYEPLTTWNQMQDGSAKLGWAPSYADNTWIIPEADMASTMTFSLKGGPYFYTHKVSEGVDESGTYSLDVNKKTISTSRGTILRSVSFIANASNWTNNLVILSLTENQLQIGVRRTNNEGDYLYVWNYISKTYADNYVEEPEEETGPDEGFNPSFAPGELLTMLTGGASSERVWKLDVSGNPIDWINKGKGWTKSEKDSRDWGWNDSWVDAVKDSYIRFDNSGGQHYSRYQNGTLTKGTFTINEATNEITLKDNTLLQNSASWMNPSTNVLKVVKAFPGEAKSKGIWFGTSYDQDKDEWFAFHYIIP